MLGAMMNATKDKKGPSFLDVVALLSDLPAQRLARGQVGTIVEQLDENISLVECLVTSKAAPMRSRRAH